MTKDPFRQFQKAGIGGVNGRRAGAHHDGKNGIYGCPCCRKSSVGLNKFKKASRKRAKNKLKQGLSKTISEQTNE